MKKDRAVIYARYSSHSQRDVSIEIQVEECTAFCRENGLKVVGTYCDYALTGRNTNRPQFQQMLIDAGRHNFDYVVIYKVTRIMRNRDEMALARITLRRSGVEILYAGETIAEGSSGVLQLGILEVLAEWESAIDSERILDGLHRNARDCMANGHKMYGWDIVDGRYVINENEKRLMVEMKDRFLAGETIADIVRALKPYRNKRGKPFVRNGVEKMLKRKQNAGIYSYAGYETVGGMPALWSMEEQRKIWAMFETKTGPTHINVEDYPLTGKLYWEQWPMIGDCGTGKSGKRYYYYRCKKNRKRVAKDTIENDVCQLVKDALDDPAKRERIADLVTEYENEQDDDVKQSDVIKREIADIDAKFENIWQAIESGIAPPGGRERIDALTERKELLETELATALTLESVKIDRNRILFWLETMAKDLDNETIIRTFVTRVTITDDDKYKVIMTFDDLGERELGKCSDGLSPAPPQESYPNFYIYAIKHGFVIVADRVHN